MDFDKLNLADEKTRNETFNKVKKMMPEQMKNAGERLTILTMGAVVAMMESDSEEEYYRMKFCLLDLAKEAKEVVDRMPGLLEEVDKARAKRAEEKKTATQKETA